MQCVDFAVGPKSGGSSDTSPPTMQSFAEESSPENLMQARMVNGQSTESLDSLSDESGGRLHHSTSNNRKHHKQNNPVPHPRKVL